jgi:undecaprenyl-diphosphatase
VNVTARTGSGAEDRGESWLRRVCANVAVMGALLVHAPRGRRRLPWFRHAAVGATAAVVAVAALMALVDVRTVRIAERIPHWLQATLTELTDFGKSGWFLFPIGLALAVIALRSTPTIGRTTRLVLLGVAVRLCFLFAAIAVPSVFTSLAKRVIGRARPYVDLAGDPFHYQPFVWRPDYASMPSGHATTAVAAAVAIGLLWPRLRAPLWVYALVILASRFLLAAHYPSDVVAGAAVGVLGAVLVRDWFAARRLGFVVAPDGGIVALPGPSFARIKRVAGRLLAP